MTEINDLIDALKNGDNVGASDVFNGLMADRINTAMDSRKIELGQSMMGGAEEPEFEEEIEPEIEEQEEDEDIYTDSESD